MLLNHQSKFLTVKSFNKIILNWIELNSQRCLKWWHFVRSESTSQFLLWSNDNLIYQELISKIDLKWYAWLAKGCQYLYSYCCCEKCTRDSRSQNLGKILTRSYGLGPPWLQDYSEHLALIQVNDYALQQVITNEDQEWRGVHRWEDLNRGFLFIKRRDCQTLFSYNIL